MERNFVSEQQRISSFLLPVGKMVEDILKDLNSCNASLQVSMREMKLTKHISLRP